MLLPKAEWWLKLVESATWNIEMINQHVVCIATKCITVVTWEQKILLGSVFGIQVDFRQDQVSQQNLHQITVLQPGTDIITNMTPHMVRTYLLSMSIVTHQMWQRLALLEYFCHSDSDGKRCQALQQLRFPLIFLKAIWLKKKNT